MKLDHYVPGDLVEVLHSIREIHVSGGEVWVRFEENSNPMAKGAFYPGSFTHELFSLLERHLNGAAEATSCARVSRYDRKPVI